MSEHSDITAPLIKALEQAGALVFRMNSGKIRLKGRVMHLHKSGTADILCFPRTGGVLWLETKAVQKDYHTAQRAAQAEFRAKVEAFGHRYVVCRSVDDGLKALEAGA